MLKKMVIKTAFSFINKLITDKVKDENLKILLSMLLITLEKVVGILTDGKKEDNKDQIKDLMQRDLDILLGAVSKVI